ncbi:MAG: hypothetical protein QHJ73_17960, partial [Armatimonadota bacterium]|nr:hypothetical protein [Armatimonadota bacterium]
YYTEALAGGTIYSASGTIQAPKYINLSGGWLRNVTLLGPGTIFVNGHLGGGVVNGYPPCTLVVTRNFVTTGGENYTFNPGNDPAPPPSLISFGPYLEIQGTSRWNLNGALVALNPNARILVNDSAITCIGALICNGVVEFKSSKGGVGFPRTLTQRRFTLRGLPVVASYSAQ